MPSAGRLLCGGFNFCLIQCRGDWEWYSNYRELPAWNQKANCCWLCKATPNGPLAWTNGDETATWRAEAKTHESFLADLAANGKEPHPIFQIQTMTIRGVMPDILHTMDQGITPHVIANVFIEVMQPKDRNVKRRIAWLQNDLDNHYKETKEAYKVQGPLTIQRIKGSDDWPWFKGKAA